MPNFIEFRRHLQLELQAYRTVKSTNTVAIEGKLGIGGIQQKILQFWFQRILNPMVLNCHMYPGRVKFIFCIQFSKKILLRIVTSILKYKSARIVHNTGTVHRSCHGSGVVVCDSSPALLRIQGTNFAINALAVGQSSPHNLQSRQHPGESPLHSLQ